MRLFRCSLPSFTFKYRVIWSTSIYVSHPPYSSISIRSLLFGYVVSLCFAVCVPLYFSPPKHCATLDTSIVLCTLHCACWAFGDEQGEPTFSRRGPNVHFNGASLKSLAANRRFRISSMGPERKIWTGRFFIYRFVSFQIYVLLSR